MSVNSRKRYQLHFSDVVLILPLGILTDREVVELFLHYTVNPKPSVGFGDTPRCCLTGKEQVVCRSIDSYREAFT